MNKQDVLQYIRKGKDNAITGKRIAEYFGELDDRKVRIIIRELIEEGHAIASSVHHPYGYFIIETKEEYEEYMAVLNSRAIDNFNRRKAFRRAGHYLFSEQGALL